MMRWRQVMGSALKDCRLIEQVPELHLTPLARGGVGKFKWRRVGWRRPWTAHSAIHRKILRHLTD